MYCMNKKIYCPFATPSEFKSNLQIQSCFLTGASFRKLVKLAKVNLS